MSVHGEKWSGNNIWFCKYQLSGSASLKYLEILVVADSVYDHIIVQVNLYAAL